MHNISPAPSNTGTVPPTASGDGPTIAPPTPESPCEDFNLRLSNQVFSVEVSTLTGESLFFVEGTVEVCIDGVFYAICDKGWDQEDAQVACTVLNYEPSAYRKLFSTLFVSLS